MALRPNAGHGLLMFEVSRSHTTTYHSRYDSSGRVISSSQRPLPDNTQHSQQKNIHAPGGIRIRDLSRRAATDLRLRPRCHWDRILLRITYHYIFATVPIKLETGRWNTYLHNSDLQPGEKRVATFTHRPLQLKEMTGAFWMGIQWTSKFVRS